MKLLLFDIDGTLLMTHGIGRIALEEALQTVLDRPLSTGSIRFAGKTDRQILREVFKLINADPEGDAFQEVLDVYTANMQAMLTPEGVKVLPGVPALLSYLHDLPDIQLALLTGNMHATAVAKLAAVGLDHFFPFGGFGSDHEDRYQLPALVVDRALRHTGHTFVGKDVVIIGDTEHDIRCGRAINAFSVGVCTGHYRREELAAHQPDALLDDLNDLPHFTQIIGASSV